MRAIGPGAHGRVIVDGVRRATSTERSPETWAALVEAEDHGIIEDVALSRAEEADEALLMGVRLTEGIDLSRLAARTGLSPRRRTIDELAELQLIERLGADRLRATASGRMVLNEVVLRLAQSFEPARAAGNY